MPSLALLLLLTASPCCAPPPGDADLAATARAALTQATDFFRTLSIEGGYAGIYSLDLKERYGEALYEPASPTEIWVQPPGTPSVGATFLRLYRLTENPAHLEAAVAAGKALAWGQSTLGGWDHRVDVAGLEPESIRPTRDPARNTFDDNITQGALAFLMELDQAIDADWLTHAVTLGLAFLQESQFDNGAWPQWYPLRGGYHDYYTFNDNAINDCIAVLVEAHRQYGDEAALAAARRGGAFIVQSQYPPPQSGWAQQYSHDLEPAWARTFEPLAICSAATARNVRTLIELYGYTGEASYLVPIPAAFDWLDRSQLAPGHWARLYEVGTNRPIYGDRDGEVHYTLEEISEERRNGYGWQGSFGIPEVRALYERVLAEGREAAKPPSHPLLPSPNALAPQVRAVIAALDDQGRWVRNERLYAADFVRNASLLITYLESLAAEDG